MKLYLSLFLLLVPGASTIASASEGILPYVKNTRLYAVNVQGKRILDGVDAVSEYQYSNKLIAYITRYDRRLSVRDSDGQILIDQLRQVSVVQVSEGFVSFFRDSRLYVMNYEGAYVVNGIKDVRMVIASDEIVAYSVGARISAVNVRGKKILDAIDHVSYLSVADFFIAYRQGHRFRGVSSEGFEFVLDEGDID